MKTKMINGPEDGSIYALIKNDLVYLVTAHSGVEAMHRLEKMKMLNLNTKSKQRTC